MPRIEGLRLRLRLRTAAAMLALGVLAACGSTTDPEPREASGRSAEPSPGASAATPSASPTPQSAPIPTEYDERADAAADVRAALAASRSDGKPVLLDFGADWCPDCRVLEKLYHQPAVTKQLNEGFHLVLVDVGEFDANLALASKYLQLRTSGIPALVVVREGRAVYASNRGQFANARTMRAPQLQSFLARWAA